MGIVELRRLRLLEEKNRKLKQLVADLSQGKHILQEGISKSSKADVEATPLRPRSENWASFCVSALESAKEEPASHGASGVLR